MDRSHRPDRSNLGPNEQPRDRLGGVFLHMGQNGVPSGSRSACGQAARRQVRNQRTMTAFIRGIWTPREQFAMHPPVRPRWVVPRQVQHQGAHRAYGTRPATPAGLRRGRVATCGQVTMPPQDCIGTHQQPQTVQPAAASRRASDFQGQDSPRQRERSRQGRVDRRSAKLWCVALPARLASRHG
jgi:hypothetical protein